jgi:hypothetical protein
MRKKTEYEYVVQTRPSGVRGWNDYDAATPFHRHKDALDLAKSLINEPSNRGHDWYYKVLKRPRR